MSLGTITPGVEVGREGGPVVLINMSFLGDDSYPTGGTTGFQALVRADVGADVEVLAIVPQDCGLFTPSYDKAADTLLVRDIGDGAEVGNAVDLSGTTFNVLLVAK